MAAKKRTYGDGSIYQRKSDGLWIGTFEAGWTEKGTRRRLTVSGKTRAEAARRLRQKKAQFADGGAPTGNARTTVKVYAERWLERKAETLRPKAFAATQTNVRKWIIPTIGHKRIEALTPADVRSIETKIRSTPHPREVGAFLSAGTAAGVFRTVQNMLGDAVEDGHAVARAIEKMSAPAVPESDRRDLSLAETLDCLAVASELPHGLRWLLALLYGARQGETLGLIEVDPLDGEPLVDFDNKVIHLAWQLQALRYVDRQNRAAGFKVPRDHEAVHLVDAWHLVRPKSKKGHRVIPMLPPVETAMREWLAIRPENPWGLVFPTLNGRPCNDKIDREEWWAIQGSACVGHPRGRYYHVHECRNVAATQLDEVGATENVVTGVLGHASYRTSRGYMGQSLDAKRAALELVAERYGLA